MSTIESFEPSESGVPNRAGRRARARTGRRTSHKLGALGSGAVLATSATAAMLALTAAPAGATTLTVDTTADGPATPTDCTTPVAGSCSLRDALNAAVDGDVIDATTISGAIALNSGNLYTDDAITLRGPGSSNLTVDAGGSSRVLYANGSSGTTTISGMTFTNGDGGSDAGGAMVFYCGGSGSLVLDDVTMTNSTTTDYGGGLGFYEGCSSVDATITNSTFTGNTAGGGGGISFYQGHDLTIVNTTVAGNSALYDGGGVLFYGGNDLTIRNSTISGNNTTDSSGDGGGLYTYASGTTTIDNSTIADNHALGYGGGVAVNGGDLVMIQSTVSGNTAVGLGDGLYLNSNASSASGKADTQTRTHVNPHHPAATAKDVGAQDAGSAALTGTIVSGNPGTDIDSQSGAVTSTSSLIGTVGAGIALTDAGGTQTGITNPGLGALANNGGPTQTMALLAGSPALDKGPNPVPSFTGNAFDQRGAGYPRVVNGIVDVGAYEFQPIAIVPRFTG